MGPRALTILAVTPGVGVAGGQITIKCRGFKPGMPTVCRVFLGETDAEIVTASEEKVILRLPYNPSALGLTLSVGGSCSEVFPFNLATRLVASLHPVSSPVIAPDGSIITTRSGSRGQQVSQPLIRVTRQGELLPYNCTLMNPTGLAFGPDGQLYVSSRNDGVVYRYTDFQHLEPIAEDLGVACGLAFDSQANLFVGDRSGKIYRIDPGGKKTEFATLEPSVSAYHLAIDAQDRLYVTGPTLSMRDPLYRISPSGAVEVVLHGLARPQGLAIAADGSLLVTASFQGEKGVFRLGDSGTIEHYIAAPTLVGVAVAGEEIFLVDSTSVYWVRPSGAAHRPI